MTNEQKKHSENAEQPENVSAETVNEENEAQLDDVEIIGGEGDLGDEFLTEDEAAQDDNSQVNELLAALQASETQLQEQKDSVLRAKAEVENMRRRSEQEIDKARKYALNKFAEELLPVIDNLERAMAAADSENEIIKPLYEGVEMTHKSMITTVAKFGLKEINPEGEAFNPEYHQAMGMQESPDHEPNTVMMVMQKGYELNGRVIRPAMVMVAK
ncbi:MAG: nucleotide exchange factor GrpE [Vibrio sp.]